MPSRAACLLAVPLLLVSNLFAEDSGGASEPRSSVRIHLRESIMSHLPPKSAEVAPAKATPTAASTGDVVKLPPFVVKDIPFPRNEEIDAGMQKAKALESHAVYHKDLPGRRRLEIGLPIEPGSRGGGFSLPLLRLSW